MPKILSSDMIIRVLLLHGFSFISQRGSHKKYRKIEKSIIRTVIVPAAKKEIPLGTFRSIARQAGISHEDFF